MRGEGGRPSGYTPRRLLSHFWGLVLSSGTRPLRWVSALGAAAVLLAPVVALVLVVGRATKHWEAPGWTSTMILLMVASGIILFSLGVIAEHVRQHLGVEDAARCRDEGPEILLLVERVAEPDALGGEVRG